MEIHSNVRIVNQSLKINKSQKTTTMPPNKKQQTKISKHPPKKKPKTNTPPTPSPKKGEGMQVCQRVISIDYVTMEFLTCLPQAAWESSEHCWWKGWCSGLRSTGKCWFALSCELKPRILTLQGQQSL